MLLNMRMIKEVIAPEQGMRIISRARSARLSPTNSREELLSAGKLMRRLSPLPEPSHSDKGKRRASRLQLPSKEHVLVTPQTDLPRAQLVTWQS